MPIAQLVNVTRLLVVPVLGLASPLAGAEAENQNAATKPVAAADADPRDDDEILSLAAYNVKADRIEDFGFRIESMGHSEKLNAVTMWFATYAPTIVAVVPNTAAAKAGLRPGERILKSEGKSTVGGPFSTGKFGQWSKTQKKKWAEVAAGKKNVTWTLEVESPVTKAVRTVQLVVPTPPPHWGASVWRPPEGRPSATVRELGPLAERSRAILDNGIAISFDWGLKKFLDVPRESEATGCEWHLEKDGDGGHQIFVTQVRGRTDVIFATFSVKTGLRYYLTSPSGTLEKAWRWRQATPVELAPAEARIGFAHELDLWTTKVGKVSARWPFELKPGYDANAIFAVLTPKSVAPAAAAAARPLPPEFLQLRPATEGECTLFADAYGKLGLESDSWAYTETSRGFADKRVRVTRVDPSKSEAERSVLLSIDGQPPTPAEVQQWRDDGGDTPKVLGDIPPLASLVDLKHLRVFKEEAGAVIFELPLRNGSAEFPAEKFQALFRVSTAHRSLEEIAVKLRDSFRLAGVVKVTEAGLEMRFQTLDPALAPQPVWLKAGGGARVLLVKISRSFDATRSEFKRVTPFDEPAASER